MGGFFPLPDCQESGLAAAVVVRALKKRVDLLASAVQLFECISLLVCYGICWKPSKITILKYKSCWLKKKVLLLSRVFQIPTVGETLAAALQTRKSQKAAWQHGWQQAVLPVNTVPGAVKRCMKCESVGGTRGTSAELSSGLYTHMHMGMGTCTLVHMCTHKQTHTWTNIHTLIHTHKMCGMSISNPTKSVAVSQPCHSLYQTQSILFTAIMPWQFHIYLYIHTYNEI